MIQFEDGKYGPVIVFESGEKVYTEHSINLMSNCNISAKIIGDEEIVLLKNRYGSLRDSEVLTSLNAEIFHRYPVRPSKELIDPEDRIKSRFDILDL